MITYIESMTRFVIQSKPWKQLIIRIWRQEEGSGDANCEREAIAVINKLPKEAKQIDMAIAILEIDRVNAVEVLDEKGNGPVVYKDWP